MTDTEAAARPINQALAPADLQSVRSWSKAIAEFFPKRAARLLNLIDGNRPVGQVRNEFRVALSDVHRLEAEIAAGKLSHR